MQGADVGWRAGAADAGGLGRRGGDGAQLAGQGLQPGRPGDPRGPDCTASKTLTRTPHAAFRLYMVLQGSWTQWQKTPCHVAALYWGFSFGRFMAPTACEHVGCLRIGFAKAVGYHEYVAC